MTPLGRAIFAVGLGTMGFGLAGLLRNADETEPLSWATFFVGSLVAHDAVWAPAVLVGGFLLVAFLPGWLTPIVQTTLFVTAAAVLVAIPPLTGAGRLANNPSILPHDYGSHLAIVVGVIWMCGALAAVRARARAAVR